VEDKTRRPDRLFSRYKRPDRPPTCPHCHLQHDRGFVCAATALACQPYPVDLATMTRRQTSRTPTGPLYWPERARLTAERSAAALYQLAEDMRPFNYSPLVEEARRIADDLAKIAAEGDL